MVTNPEQWVEDFANAGADGFTFHIEATKDPKSLIEDIKAKKMKVGIALKPATGIDRILDFCEEVDMILVMTVGNSSLILEPGFGGQKMMPECLEKVRALRDLYPSLDIQVDGGIVVDNINRAAASGANVIVSGTGIFGHSDPKKAINIMTVEVDEIIKRN